MDEREYQLDSYFRSLSPMTATIYGDSEGLEEVGYGNGENGRY